MKEDYFSVTQPETCSDLRSTEFSGGNEFNPKTTVLLIDEHDEDRVAFEQFLRNMDVLPLAVSSADAGLAILRRHKIDFVVCDAELSFSPAERVSSEIKASANTAKLLLVVKKGKEIPLNVSADQVYEKNQLLSGLQQSLRSK